MNDSDTIANEIMKSEFSKMLHYMIKGSFEHEEFQPEDNSYGNP